jgi:multimeric flavodoxin WrbA
MKLLGFSCGRKMGNTEVLVKEALMGAEDVGGVEVEFVRLLDMDIRACRFCKVCLKWTGGPEACIIKDDAAFLYNCIMDCDGLILGAPVYSLDRPGLLKMFEDRMLGPTVDAAGVRELIKGEETGEGTRVGPNFSGGQRIHIDRRVLKMRVGALITDGGASTPHWVCFALPLLYTFTFSPQIEIIDHLSVLKAQPYPLGMVVLHDKAIKRARLLGRHVAEAMKKPIEQVKWMGDEPGMCPVCHCNLLLINGKNPVECPVCGISGTLKVDGDKISVNFPQKQREHSRLTLLGKLDHQIEIRNIMAEQAPRASEVPPKVEKYKNYLTPLKPPKKRPAKDNK